MEGESRESKRVGGFSNKLRTATMWSYKHWAKFRDATKAAMKIGSGDHFGHPYQGERMDGEYIP